MARKIDASPRHLEELLSYLDITNEELAVLAGVHWRTVYRWLSENSAIPHSLIRLLELMAMSMEITEDGGYVTSWTPESGYKLEHRTEA